MADQSPEQPDTSVLDRILRQGGQTEVKPVELQEGGCPNCANQGKTNKLNDQGVCGTCGYEKPNY